MECCDIIYNTDSGISQEKVKSGRKKRSYEGTLILEEKSKEVKRRCGIDNLI